MYHGKHSVSRAGRAPRRSRMSRTALVLAAVVLVLGAAIGGTVAWLATNTPGLTNTFTPGEVKCTVEETFDGKTKSGVQIKNTGNTDAYIRAKVVVTWKDAAGNVYGGATPAEGTDYTISYNASGWTQVGDYRYCTQPVAPNGLTPKLISEAKPVDGKAPAGYALSIEILAEAIQSSPASAVQEAWGVTIANGSVTAYSAGN